MAAQSLKTSKMLKINLPLKTQLDHSHQILIENSLLGKIPMLLKKGNYGQKYIIITDENLKKIHLNKFITACEKENLETFVISIKPGEKSKKLATVEQICEKLSDEKFHRHDCLIAFGGGVIGDITGLCASLFMRGIAFVQIPTTILAMADSSIGGKTGINLKNGKNLIGTFHQPKAVFIDPQLLKTLPKKELQNGLAEIIKHAIIKNQKFFEFIEKNIAAILKLNPATIEKLLFESAKIKTALVAHDEKERNSRMLLNYGHTFGHAIEKISNYEIPHGYAVSLGICLINKIAQKKAKLSQKDRLRIKNLLKKAGLPIEEDLKIPLKEVFKHAHFDKKHHGATQNFVICEKIGSAKIVQNLLS